MNYNELSHRIVKIDNYLCVGLDPDWGKIPDHIQREPDALFWFNKAIVDATADYCVAYKPNLAFYECHGPEGMLQFKETVRYIKEKYPDKFVIADAKRGDIGNTSKMYAKAFFECYGVDAITVAPYMGEDSIRPFLEYRDKWVIILAVTSNKGHEDFQTFRNNDGTLYEKVLETASKWGSKENTMFVIGATQPETLAQIRKNYPEHFLLIPGVGAQGGSLDEVSRLGLNKHVGILVNSSRGIIHASSGEDFAVRAGEEAKKLAQEMSNHLLRY